jgi:5-methylcytosine-specific restriction endonuclease McrA
MNKAVDTLIKGRTILLGRVPDDVANMAIERAKELGIELNIVDASTKHCPGCDQDLPTDSFIPKGKNPRTGTRYYTRLCRDCHNAERRADPRERERYNKWKEENRDWLNQYMREWRAENPGYDTRSQYLTGRLRVKPEEWDRLIEQFGGCAYCGGEAEEVDHFIPRSQGGTDDWDNLVPACRHCNASKNDNPPQEWCSPEDFERISAILSC